MATSTLLSIRLPVKSAQKLKSLAATLKRSKSFLGAEAIEEYLAHQEWQIEAIKQGIRSADQGRLVSHANVNDWVNSWGRSKEKKLPAK